MVGEEEQEQKGRWISRTLDMRSEVLSEISPCEREIRAQDQKVSRVCWGELVHGMVSGSIDSRSSRKKSA